MKRLTVLEHGHDVLLDHGQDDLASQPTGDAVQSALPSHCVTKERREGKRSVPPKVQLPGPPPERGGQYP